jgi:class 3 adenylate cyclase
MGLKDDITDRVKVIFAEQWKTREGQVVPEPANVGLSNDAVLMKGTVLYADLSGSTNMVDKHKPHFAAEVYKAYLYSTARVIRSEGGEIVAYDGDRVMAIFIGGSKNTSAARCGLNINWAAKKIVAPALKAQYPNSTFALRHVVGIDTSDLWVANTGIRGANDLVWVGAAANYAAKLTELSADYPTWITHRVYDSMAKEAKDSQDGTPMWEARVWKTMGDLSIYRSTFTWSLK